MISEIGRVLKKNGRLYLTTPNVGHGYYKGKHKIDLRELKSLMNASDSYFRFEVFGYNPFPRLLIPRMLVRMPAIHKVLNYLKDRKFFTDKGRTFYVEAIKVR